MRRRVAIGGAIGLLLLAGYVALALWVEERERRFFIASGPRRWGDWTG